MPSLYRGRSAKNGNGSSPSGDGSDARTHIFVPKSSINAATETIAATALVE